MECPPMMAAVAEIESLLSHPQVTDVCINGTESLYFDRGHGMEALTPSLRWNATDLQNWVLSLLSSVNKTWDARYPFVDATLLSGHRIHVVFPPLSSPGITVSLRKLPRLSQPGANTKSTPVWGDSPSFEILRQAVLQKESVLISGSTGSGKTTLMNDLLGEIPQHERIVALEDTPELSPAHRHFISLTSRLQNADGFGLVSLRDLLKQSLRMRPDRIVLGECRGEEVMELLQALNTGHGGALATLHANSPRDALRRLELLCLLSTGGAISRQTLRDLISSGLRWIAHVERRESRRIISEVCRIEGLEGDTILIRPMLK